MPSEYNIICPNCEEKMYFNVDGYGRTPYHLHCRNCYINIGAQSMDKCISLFNDHHKKDTYIEYYGGEIKLFMEERKVIINKEFE